MTTPRVSVVMNVRNGAPWLREAIDSVLAQTFTDWEFVIWDDRSTDNSASVIAEYSDPRIRYFLSDEDTPLGTARNLAVRQARGEWIAFLDQDDIWLPKKLEWQLAIVDGGSGRSVGLVYGRTVEFFPGGRQRDFDHHHEFTTLPEGNLLPELFRKSCFIAISSAMIRRSAFQEIPNHVQLISDFYIFLSVSQRFESRAVQQVVCRYRRHETSLSRGRRQEMYQEALVLLKRWPGPIAPELETAARTSYHTALAIGELMCPDSFASGARRLLRHGSVPYVLSRPFARVWRSLRLRYGSPLWRSLGEGKQVVRRGETRSRVFERKLSIIVVNWKVRELLRECLQSVYEFLGIPDSDWELIVVDNDSQDGSAEMVARQFPGVKLIVNSGNVGFARANNQALRECSGEFVLLLNPDAALLDGSIARMLERIEREPEAGVFGCRLLNSDRTLQRWTAGAVPGVANIACHFLFLYKLLPEWLLPKPFFLESEPPAETVVGWVSGACMLLRRDALADEIFDAELFMYGEDLRLCQLLAAAGWKVIYTPDCEVMHHGGSSIDQQTPEVQFQKISNLRRVFQAANGRLALIGFDLAVSIGFLIRLIGFRLAAATRPGRGYDVRAQRSWHYLAQSVRLLCQRTN